MPDFEFRRVGAQDFAFCWSIYRDAMEPLTVELMKWNEPAQRQIVERALGDEGTSILVVASSDAGWLHVIETRHDIHLQHLYLLPEMRNRGLGTSFLRWMGERATRKSKLLTLEVIRNNRARLLYERLGFGVVGTADQKLRMQLQAGP